MDGIGLERGMVSITPDSRNLKASFACDRISSGNLPTSRKARRWTSIAIVATACETMLKIAYTG
jgi:hypothetical protein